MTNTSNHRRGNVNSAFVIVNGRRMPVGNGHRTVVIGGERTGQIAPNRVCPPTGLADEFFSGQRVKCTIGPDRTGRKGTCV